MLCREKKKREKYLTVHFFVKNALEKNYTSKQTKLNTFACCVKLTIFFFFNSKRSNSL